MGLREELIYKIKLQGNPNEYDQPCPIIDLESFFEGNEDIGSIGCNLHEHPGIGTFYKVLKKVRQREDVLDVLVEIYEIDEENDEVWPFSERIYIITKAKEDDVASWIAALEFDEIDEGWQYGKPQAAPEFPPGYTVYSVWWD
jgi:hypothetical protein